LRTQTERLLLRPYEEGDLPVFGAMHGRADVARYLMWEPRDEVAARDALTKNIARTGIDEDRDALCLAAFTRETGAFVGEFVLFMSSRPNRTGETGYIIDPAAAGHGYATEGCLAMLRIGFVQCGMHRIIGRIDARNAASARVLEKCGLRREAHFVRNELVKGEWCDEVVYAVLTDEWQAREDG
jgi:RimJ/RimL family protein N-acetyltransferase